MERHVPLERPSVDEELKLLKTVVAPSLKTSLEKEKSKKAGEEIKNEPLSCKNNGCDKVVR